MLSNIHNYQSQALHDFDNQSQAPFLSLFSQVKQQITEHLIFDREHIWLSTLACSVKLRFSRHP